MVPATEDSVPPLPARAKAALLVMGAAWAGALALTFTDPTTQWGILWDWKAKAAAASDTDFQTLFHRTQPWDYLLSITVFALPILVPHFIYPQKLGYRLGLGLSSLIPAWAMLLGIYLLVSGGGTYVCSRSPWFSADSPADLILMSAAFLAIAWMISVGLQRLSSRLHRWETDGWEGLLKGRNKPQ